MIIQLLADKSFLKKNSKSILKRLLKNMKERSQIPIPLIKKN